MGLIDKTASKKSSAQTPQLTAVHNHVALWPERIIEGPKARRPAIHFERMFSATEIFHISTMPLCATRDTPRLPRRPIAQPVSQVLIIASAATASHYREPN
jgi:hypothetical protein